MKKTLLLLTTITLFLAACGGSSSDTEQTSNATTPVAEEKPAMEPGQLLIAKSDCIGCHKKDEKLIGPSYVDIATKYPANDENISLLAGKILTGGKGVWGAIPMTPHKKLTEDEAKTIVKYILSLKK
jgi:cytochrome c